MTTATVGYTLPAWVQHPTSTLAAAAAQGRSSAAVAVPNTKATEGTRMGDEQKPYHVSDLTGDQEPDPLGDKNLTPAERVGAGQGQQEQPSQPAEGTTSGDTAQGDDEHVG